jgi:hypothetical protein
MRDCIHYPQSKSAAFELRIRRVNIITLGLAFVFLISTGCGSNSGPSATVSGKVSLNGNPLGNASVTFVGSVSAQAATTDSQGAFAIKTPLSPGNYRVSISPPAEAAPSEDSAEYAALMAGKPSAVKPSDFGIPAKYHSTGSSGLAYELAEGINQIEINLE